LGPELELGPEFVRLRIGYLPLRIRYQVLVSARW
jgi:hypothetical protein